MTPKMWADVRTYVEDALLLDAARRREFLERSIADPELLSVALRLVGFDDKAAKLFAIERWKQILPPPLDGAIIGNFRTISELGRGGMGTVYLAERADGLYQQQVAIKVLQETIHAPEMAERFQRERQILARLRHPGIARLLDGGVTLDQRPYLVMEYVDGRPIDVYCDEQALDLNARLRLCLCVAEAVQSAHQQLVLHLDLKPANILITGDGTPRLLDFGIARLLSEAGGDANQSEASLKLLTPRYASPEQVAGAELGVESDVFSLATLVYKLLTGGFPYPVENASPLEATRILNEMQPMPPSQAAPVEHQRKLRGDLDLILLRALRKEPERRYPTMAAFADDVQRYLDFRPVEAHADSLGYRFGRFIRRNRIAVAAASLAVTMLLFSAAAVVHSNVAERRQRDLAERRFKDLQTLAHGYIFDLDPKLEDIPGTVKVRAYVMQNALSYLDALSAERNGDDALSRELGRGYMRIAQLQSHEGMASLSDRSGAMRSLQKSYVLQKYVLDKHPDDLVQRGQVVSNLRLMADHERDDGRLEASQRYAKQAWDIGQPILLAGPHTRNFHTMVNVAFTFAENLGAVEEGPTLGDPAGALPWLDHVHDLAARYAAMPLADQPNPELPFIDLRHENMIRASVFHQLGRDAEARSAYEEALRVSASLAQGSPVARIGVMVTRYTYANFLLEVHDPIHAAAVAPPVVLPSAAEKKDVDRQQLIQVADLLALHTRIDLQLDHGERARRELTEFMALFEKLYREDSKDNLANIQMVASYFDVGQEPRLGLVTRRQLLQRGLDVLAPALAASPHGFEELMKDAQGRLRWVDTCDIAIDCPGREAELDRASLDLRTVLSEHPGTAEATLMLAHATQLRSRS